MAQTSRRYMSMSRILLAALGAHGFAVSLKATRNIRELRRNALAGDTEAQHHFTQTRYARVFGPRNSDLGMLFYAIVHLAAATGLVRNRRVLDSMLLGSAVSLGTSAFLLWALFARLRVWCQICMQGHVLNGAVFILLAKMWQSQRSNRQD